jgi:protein-S-isoprenylcysteine O-methyltransferase Ste14
MSDRLPQEWSERVRTVLARWRVRIGFAAAALVLWLAEPSARTIVAGSAVACVGEGIRIWAAGHLHKSREVTSSGPYRWTAHPLYIGSSIMGAGLAIASGSAPAALGIMLYLGIMLTVAARNEEASLRRAFGTEYERYRIGDAATVGAARRFSLSQAIANREHRAIIGLLVAVLLLALKAASGV